MVLKAALNKDHKYDGNGEKRKKEEEEEDDGVVEVYCFYEKCHSLNNSTHHEQPSQKHARLKEEGETGEFSKETRLQLNKTEAYKHGPIPMDTLVYSTSDELIHASNAFKHSIETWVPTPLHLLISSTCTLSTLQQLSPSASLMGASVPSHTGVCVFVCVRACVC